MYSKEVVAIFISLMNINELWVPTPLKGERGVDAGDVYGDTLSIFWDSGYRSFFDGGEGYLHQLYTLIQTWTFFPPWTLFYLMDT